MAGHGYLLLCSGCSFTFSLIFQIKSEAFFAEVKVHYSLAIKAAFRMRVSFLSRLHATTTNINADHNRHSRKKKEQCGSFLLTSVSGTSKPSNVF